MKFVFSVLVKYPPGASPPRPSRIYESIHCIRVIFGYFNEKCLSDKYEILLINPIDCHVKYSLFSVEFFVAVILREGNGHFNAIAWMSADELFFKVIDIASGTDSQVCSLPLCVAAVELDPVN